MPLSDFPWPPVGVDGVVPVWTGDAFRLGGQPMRVIAYAESDSHWSESLTTMHEEVAGRIGSTRRSVVLAALFLLETATGRVFSCPAEFV